MLWAAFCLGFFGFLRAGEFTCPSQSACPSDMLIIDDVAIDSHEAPSHMMIHLKRSKTDPFGAGFTLHLGRTGNDLCPIAAMLGYFARRPPGPVFFCFQVGIPLSRTCLCLELGQALTAMGIDTAGYSGHNFRIRAATTAAQAGFSDSLIQALVCWKSSGYIRMQRSPVSQPNLPVVRLRQ